MAIAKKNGRTLSTLGSFAREGSKEERRGEESSPRRERRWFLALETLIGRENRLKQDGDRFERR